VVGRAAHAGVEPEKGVSAIEELAHQIPRIKALADAGRGTTVNVGVIRGGTRSNVVAAEAEALIDIRLATRDEATRVDRAMRALSPVLPGALVTAEGGMERPPMERTEGVARLAALAKTVAHELGFELEEASTGGGSDGNFTAALGIPTLDGLGPDGGGAHADSEHLLVSSWLQRTQLLARLLERI
jgi:glutamate carboxypeptidase